MALVKTFHGKLFAAAMVATGAASLFAGEFKAGFARTDITPPLGTPLAGYYSRRVSEGVFDPLYARCLAVSDGESRAIVLSLDNLHLADKVFKDVREAVSSRTGVPAEAVFVACTHTHTGPSTYVPSSPAAKADADIIRASNKILVDGCAEAAASALADLAPSKIKIGRGEARNIAFIRRYRMKDGSVRTNPGPNNPKIDHPLGEQDEQLQLVRFVREGRPEIALVNFQTHPDVIGGKKISADWPGLSCGYLEAAMGGSVRAIFINGAEGDSNHIKTNIAPGEVVPMRILPRYEMSHHMARVVAGAALATWGACVDVEAGKVSAGISGVAVEPNKGTPEELEAARKTIELHKAGRDSDIKKNGGIPNLAAAYRMFEVKNMPDTVEIPVSMVTIGKSVAFGGFPGEPFTWMGTELKSRSPFLMTIPACCVNGSRGYFPVKSAFETKGGYENATSRYKAGTAERLVEGLIKNLDAAYGKSCDMEKTYCAIDVSGGPNAAAYPVSYLDAPPESGWGDEFKTTKILMRRIEPGSVKMAGIKPVKITKPFYIGVFEITQKQYELVTGATPSQYKGDTRPVECVSWNTIRGRAKEYNWPSVTNVAPASFIGRLRAKTGLCIDLPTEAQWEYACRAGTTSAYNNGGSGESDLRQLGRFAKNRFDGRGGSGCRWHTVVGSYAPNAWGLYDMHGNVREWCLDWSAEIDGTPAEDYVGPAFGSERVRRGGSWDINEGGCTSFRRDSYNPGVDDNNYYGIRIVRR